MATWRTFCHNFRLRCPIPARPKPKLGIFRWRREPCTSDTPASARITHSERQGSSAKDAREQPSMRANRSVALFRAGGGVVVLTSIRCSAMYRAWHCLIRIFSLLAMHKIDEDERRRTQRYRLSIAHVYHLLLTLHPDREADQNRPAA